MFDNNSHSPQPDSENDMDTNSNDNSNVKSWQDFKEEGKRHFRNANYTEALVSFQEALGKIETEEQQQQQQQQTGSNSINFIEERQILLSNSVACRLKINDTEMKIVAIEEAKKVRRTQ